MDSPDSAQMDFPDSAQMDSPDSPDLVQDTHREMMELVCAFKHRVQRALGLYNGPMAKLADQCIDGNNVMCLEHLHAVLKDIKHGGEAHGPGVDVLLSLTDKDLDDDAAAGQASMVEQMKARNMHALVKPFFQHCVVSMVLARKYNTLTKRVEFIKATTSISSDSLITILAQQWGQMISTKRKAGDGGSDGDVGGSPVRKKAKKVHKAKAPAPVVHVLGDDATDSDDA